MNKVLVGERTGGVLVWRPGSLRAYCTLMVRPCHCLPSMSVLARVADSTSANVTNPVLPEPCERVKLSL